MEKDYKEEFLNKLKEIIAKAEKNEEMDLGDTINDVDDLIEEYEVEEE